ncbi:MAG: hypothetical protein M3P51_17355 [Chloroflexota bacterium]|nr:hypothetical protein [Chloroflexota bacterium]
MLSAFAVSSVVRWRMLLVGGLVGICTALLIGVPTDVIPTVLFTRMTPVRPQDYAFLVLSSVLAGLVAASYTVPAPCCDIDTGKVATSGFLGFLAIGCPVCNKVVLLLLGTSGTYTYWAPLQPVLGTVSVLLLVVALWLRLHALRTGCPTLP